MHRPCTLKANRGDDIIPPAWRWIGALLCVVLLFYGQIAHAQSKLELKQIDQTLQRSERELKQDIAKRKQIMVNIQGIEEQIAERTLRYNRTQSKVKSLDKQSERIQTERDSLEADFSKAKYQLSKLLESTYLMGRQSALKVALSPQGAQHMTRLNHYARDIATARKDQLDNLSALQTQLAEKDRQLSEQQKKTRKLATALESDQRYLTRLKNNRMAMVEQLDQSIDDGTTEVALLRARKARLQKLLADIAVRQKARAASRRAQQKRLQAARETRNARVKTPPPEKVKKSRNFEFIPGNLPMPVKAKIVARFGDKRKNSGVPWTGILLEGKAGSRIKAIGDGEIVYADWLPGYGQMVIVDHGNGIMSLYGHNKRILKAVGDSVRQSDTIATMGDTAGLKRAGLYFEIRQNGVAQDPLKWCRI